MRQKLQLKSVCFNSDQSQSDRLVSFKKMKLLNLKVIICTDLLARGVDFPDVRIVVNLDEAYSPSQAQHRVGRASRWDSKAGLTIGFSYASDSNVEGVRDLVREILADSQNTRVESRIQKEQTLFDKQDKCDQSLLQRE